MARRNGWIGLVWLASLGCVNAPQMPALVSGLPIGGTASASHIPKDAPPATREAALKVAEVGRKILAANPSLGIEPQFQTVGGESPAEVFHRGSDSIIITESLARQCKTEAELAAVLSIEIGKIMAEKVVPVVVSVPDRGAPIDAPVGSEYGGRFGSADGTRMMEMGRYEKRRERAREQALPPAPDVLAKDYLQHAGYDPNVLQTVAPLLRSADAHSSLEKAMLR